MDEATLQKFVDAVVPSQMKEHLFHKIEFHWDGARLNCIKCNLFVRLIVNEKMVGKCYEDKMFLQRCVECSVYEHFADLWFPHNVIKIPLSEVDTANHRVIEIINDHSCLNRQMNTACK